jgi:hypothetical protein
MMLRKPKNIFLLDAFGAALSAVLLSFVLVIFEPYFGMPAAVLYQLGVIAGVFTIYSFSCYLLVHDNWQFYLRIIAIANSLYGLASIVLVVYHSSLLTTLGYAYFLGEIAVLAIIIYIEFKTIKMKDS